MTGLESTEVHPVIEECSGETGWRLTVLMCIYNELHTMRRAINGVLAVAMPVEYELLVIENGSTDGSADLLREMMQQDSRIKARFISVNRGKSAAVRYGIEQASGNVFLVHDADLEYEPADIPRVIQPILDGDADAVFGNRFAMRERRRALYFWNALGNKVLTFWANYLADLNLNDIETSYKACRIEILRQLNLHEELFGLEPELMMRLAQWRARIYEVPISYHGRSYEAGKKGGWIDGVHALWILFYCARINRRFTTYNGFYEQTSISGDWTAFVYGQFKQFVGQSVLDAGCGIGNFTRHLIERRRLVAVDKDPVFVDSLKSHMGCLEGISCLLLDLEVPGGLKTISHNIDTVVCLNVLQAIGDDEALLRQFFDKLDPGGHLILMVPQMVTSGRCYSHGELRRKLIDAGFNIVWEKEFNRAGVLSVLIDRLQGGSGTSTPSYGHSHWSWFARLLESLPLPGQSRIVVARKT